MLLNYLLISLILLISKNHSFSIPHKKNYHANNHRIHNKNNDIYYNHHNHHQFDKLLNLHATNNITPDTSKTSDITTTDDEAEEYRKCLINTIGWVSAAAGFAGFIAFYKGIPSAIEFCSGYVLEQCLSIDNLFVILVIFNYFGIEKKYQEKPLKYGIYGAILLRGLFIGIGSVALQRFHYVLLLFAGVLLVSSYKILFSGGDDDDNEDLADSVIVKLANKILKTSDKLDGDNFFTVQDGVRMATPLLLCTICIELSDVVFAFDSVPAIFGVTEDPLIVFSSNIFAIAGLRSLFGVLSKAVTDLKYLEKAVGIILGIIAVKMGFETFDITILNPLQSLIVVMSVLGLGVGLSLYSNNNNNNSVDKNSDSNTNSSSSNSNIVPKNKSFLQSLIIVMSVLGIGVGLQSLYSNFNNDNTGSNTYSSSSSSNSNIVPKAITTTTTEKKK